MDKTNKIPDWLNDPNYWELENHYLRHPIALYTGAGVSSSDSKKFGVGDWDEFVRNILIENKVSTEILDLFDSIEWADKPWEMAEWIAISIGRNAFRDRVKTSIQKEDNFQRKYKLLSVAFLSEAKTLNSVAAFCAAFANGVITKPSKGAFVATYGRAINRRVHAVLTSNYDPFLEAASSAMFRKPTLKPVAAQGSTVGDLEEIPVFHIHGYVPFLVKFQRQGEEKRIPFVDPVVTKSDYDSAWRANDVYNPTMGPQIHILRHYSALFIGFSFRDQWVNNLLRTLNKERQERQAEEMKKKKEERRLRLYHYALMDDKKVLEKGKGFFDELGIKPISLDTYKQIPDVLGQLYKQALIHDFGNNKIELPLRQGRSKNELYKPVSLTPDQYFEELCACRLSMVHKKKSWVPE